MSGWIGVDLDGTLAHYDEWRGVEHIGAPIEPMVARVKAWLAEGRDVRIFTARVAGNDHREALPHIQEWCWRHLGEVLLVTNAKDFGMVELWDDRCVQVESNTGRACLESMAARLEDAERFQAENRAMIDELTQRLGDLW